MPFSFGSKTGLDGLNHDGLNHWFKPWFKPVGFFKKKQWFKPLWVF